MTYRDDRMYVMRLTADFIAGADGSISINGKEFILKNREESVGLITYRNIPQLPAVRFDKFSNMQEAETYIKNVEPTCPRVSLNGNGPNPAPTWEEHLEWLHSLGLKSVLEGDNPLPDWAR
jgi:hypothetical protein